jgi:hypothetical protein
MQRQLKRFLFVCILPILAVGLKYSSGKDHPRIKSLVKRCAALVAPRSVFAQGVKVLWSADMEPVAGGSGASNLAGWYEPSCCEGDDVNPPVPTADNNGGGVYNSGIASAGPSFDFAHSGAYSAMLKIDTVHTPPNTTSGTRLFRWLEPKMNNSNSDLYYSVWFYFPIAYTPNGTPNNWWNIFQWKSKSASQGKNDPMFNLEVGNWGGQMYLYLCPPAFVNGGICYPQSGPPYTSIPVGQWTHVEARYVCSGLSNGGHVTVWQDGTQLWDIANVQTRYGYSDAECSWSVNNYSNGLSPSPATIYVDDAKICQGGHCPL